MLPVYLGHEGCFLTHGGVFLSHGNYFPANSMRFKFSDPNYDPTVAFPIGPDSAPAPNYWKAGCSWTQISSEPNVWEYHREPTHYEPGPDGAASWLGEFLAKFTDYEHNSVEVLGGNTTGITSLENLFSYDDAITKVALFDTSSCWNFQQMFWGGYNQDTDTYTSHLIEVPNFDFSASYNVAQMFRDCVMLESVPDFDLQDSRYAYEMFSNCRSLKALPAMQVSKIGHPYYYDGHWLSETLAMHYMFRDCKNAASGITAMYTALSTNGYDTAAQEAGTTPCTHDRTFENCGVDSPTGSAELANVPSDWKE